MTNPAQTIDSFAARIRAATTNAHSDAEGGTYMQELMGLKLGAAQYEPLVAQHYYVYEALDEVEDALAGDPVVATFVDPDLRRMDALRKDMAALLGADWQTQMSITPETQAYVDRIREVGPGWPGGFIAHHYVRYLGDVSGGQFIARVLGRHEDPAVRDARNFYDFSALGDLDEFKDRYRAALDAAPWDAAEQERILAEILVAYHHNTQLLLGLDRVIKADS